MQENKFFNKLNNFFKIKERGSTVGKEIIAGVVIFFAMLYILPTNAAILSEGFGEKYFAGVFVATGIATFIATLIMGLIANFPVALSAGMGMNAMIGVTVCQVLGYSAIEALALILITGVLFLILSLTPLRLKIVTCIPKNLKIAISSGLGFFICFVGLQNAGIISSNKATLVQLGNFSKHPELLLAIFGILLVIGLMNIKSKVSRFAVIIGMAITAVIGIILGQTGLDNMPKFDFATSSNITSIKDVFGKCFEGIIPVLKNPKSYGVIFALIIVNLFDTTATLLAVGKDVGIMNEKGEMIGGKKAIMADAVGAVIAGLIGTSTVTSFAESAVGVETGGRTGLTAVTTGFLFLIATLLYPAFTVFSGKAGALITCSALVAVGALMFCNLKELDWEDKPSVIATFITLIFILLTYSLSEGIGIGFIFYVVMMLFNKRGKEVNFIMYLISILFLIYFVINFTMLK